MTFGFSNFRLAYDEVLARLVVSFEIGDLRRKITGRLLEERYRKAIPFARHIIDRAKFSIDTLSEIYELGIYSKLNKASLFSWLFFLGDRFFEGEEMVQSLPSFFNFFEGRRSDFAIDQHSIFYKDIYEVGRTISPGLATKCIEIFNDRSFARVNDVSSILLRDLALNLSFADIGHEAFSNVMARDFVQRHEFDLLSRLIVNLPAVGAGRALAEAELSELWGEYREARQA